MDDMALQLNNLGANVKTMEIQIGQMASTINAQQKGNFPSDTQVNPREHCKVITLRSGTTLENLKLKRNEAFSLKNKAEEKLSHEEDKEENTTKGAKKPNNISSKF
ncbi:hypothetical protein PTKIN_Ptkin05aG0131900 [Pterospermum kingtungense]